MDSANTAAVETEATRQDRARRRKIVQDARRLLTSFGALLRQLAVHDPSNAAVRNVLDELVGALGDLRASSGTVGIVFADGHTFVSGVWVRTTGRAWESAVFLTETLERFGARGLRISPSVLAPQLLQAAQTLRSARARRADDDSAPPELSVDGITLIPLPDDPEEGTKDRSRFRHEAAQILSEGAFALDSAAVVRLDIFVRRRQRALALRLVQMAEETPEDLLILTAVRDATITQVSHNLMVAILSIALGRLMDLRRRDLVRLGVCALSHNVGEALLPPELTALDRELTDDEKVQVERHPLMGMVHLLEQFGVEIPIVERALASAEHHLHFDGGGYPAIGHSTPHVFSRIIAVADIYAALTSPRPQREAFPPDQAMKLVNRRSARQLDPLMVRQFLRLVGRYPPGSLVELDTGEFGLVIGPGAGLKPLVRPRVLLLTDEHACERSELVVVDLGERHPRRKAWLRTIVRTRDVRKLAAPASRYLMANRIERTPEHLDINDPALARKPSDAAEQTAQRRFAAATQSSAPGDLSAFGLGVSSRSVTATPDVEKTSG